MLLFDKNKLHANPCNSLQISITTRIYYKKIIKGLRTERNGDCRRGIMYDNNDAYIKRCSKTY